MATYTEQQQRELDQEFSMKEARRDEARELLAKVPLPERPPPGLHKQGDSFLRMSGGGYSQAWHCVEYPEISWVVARPNRRTKLTRTFYVKDVEQQFATFGDAWVVMLVQRLAKAAK